MIPVEPFLNPAAGTREHNAVKKALKEKPSVRLLSGQEATEFYEVKGQYSVMVYRDLDDQRFIECNCAAGMPPMDDATGLPTREASPCYHAGAVLLFIAEEENPNVSN